MASTLNGSRWFKGDRQSITFTFTNFVSLPLTHPLKASGLQTSDYRLDLTVRSDPKGTAIITKTSSNAGEVTIASSTVATAEILPANTSSLTFDDRLDKGGKTLFYKWRIINTAGTIVYTMESGSFLLLP